MNRKEVAMVISISALLALFVGYAVGTYLSLNFCADTGIRILEKMDIVTNITNSEVLIKFQQHLNLLQ